MEGEGGRKVHFLQRVYQLSDWPVFAVLDFVPYEVFQVLVRWLCSVVSMLFTPSIQLHHDTRILNFPITHHVPISLSGSTYYH